VPVAYLRGLRTVKEAVDDAFTGDFIRHTIQEEIIPTLDLPEDELRQFASDVMDRFHNPYIRHELRAIALNSVSKFRVRVLPSILEYIRRRNAVPQRLAYAFACLLLFYRGEWRGESLPVKDTPEVMDFFIKAWKEQNPGAVTQTVLSNTDLWNTDLTAVPGLAAAVEYHLRNLIG
jgi:tagaturonate reductase